MHLDRGGLPLAVPRIAGTAVHLASNPLHYPELQFKKRGQRMRGTKMTLLRLRQQTQKYLLKNRRPSLLLGFIHLTRFRGVRVLPGPDEVACEVRRRAEAEARPWLP